jgi:2-phosphosulfolactate phosphatase
MTGRDILIVNSGTNGKFTMDDFITAGCMVSAMKQQNPESALSDLAAAAQLVYQAHPDIVSAMADCYHYNYLQSIGLTGDLAYCLQRDLTDTVPVLKNGIITAG